MSTTFNTNFGPGDFVEPDMLIQYAKPINDLESGTSFYREATDSSGTYSVDFRSSANPEGHAISTLSEGQIITFKASHASPASPELRVQTDLGDVNVPLYLGDAPLGAGFIEPDQIVSVIYNDTTVPRFDILGLQNVRSLDQLPDVSISAPAEAEVLKSNGTSFTNAELAINDIEGLSAALASAGASPTGHLAEVQNLTLSEGDLLTTNSSGQIVKLSAGTEGQLFQMSGGNPTWANDVGGSEPGLLTTTLVATGYRYQNITSTSDNLRTSPFVPTTGESYLVRYLSNHNTSISQLNIPSAISNGQAHYCRAEETGSSTVHNIGFSSSEATDYDMSATQRCRSIEFVWTAPNSNEVEIVLGQPSLDYGEFTGTLQVYKLKPKVTPLGWGYFGSTYSWLEDSSDTNSTVGGGAYRTGLSLDSSKTYAFIGRWLGGYSVSLCLKQGSNYWRLPPDSSTFSSVTSSQAAWNGATYYGNASWNTVFKGEIIRYFSPPNTGTFDLGCSFYGILYGCFFLLELD